MKKLIISILLALLINNNSFAKDIVMENQNEAFEQFAVELIQDEKNPTFDREFLESKQLDYSLESLHLICDFLIDADKKELNLQPYEALVRLALRTGAYVGETVRKHDKNIEWNWMQYDDAIKLQPEISQYYTKSLGTQFLMVGINRKELNKEDSYLQFSFPINKVLKNLENGKEESVYAFAITQLNLQTEIKNMETDSKNLK